MNGDWVLQVHAMNSTSRVARHTDKDDISYQYGLVLGDFDGGELITWGSDGQPHPVLNVQNKIVKLDGRLPHQVTRLSFATDRSQGSSRILEITFGAKCEF